MGIKFFLFFSFFVFATGFISAVAISDDLHVNVQVTNASGEIDNGTYIFVFNLTTDAACTNVVYSNTTTMNTDSRGIISYYLGNVNLNFTDQYWLCYYRNGTLINNSKIGRVPYAFRAKNVTSSGVDFDSNLDAGAYNFSTSTGWFKGLFNWFIGSGSDYLSFNGTALNFSESALNTTIDSRISTGSGGAITGAGTYGYVPMWNATNRLNNSIIYQNGTNIGIGTTNPQSILNINGTVGSLIGGLTFGDGDSGIYENLDDQFFITFSGVNRWYLNSGEFKSGTPYGGALKRDAGTASNPAVTFANDEDTGFYTDGSNKLQVTTNGSNRIVIDSIGNVGINTTTPEGLLELSGGHNSAGTTGKPQLVFDYNAGGNYPHYISTRHNSADSLNAIDFYVNNGTGGISNVKHVMSLVSGNVGINTTAPNSTLQVVGNTNITGNVSIGSSTVFMSGGDLIFRI